MRCLSYKTGHCVARPGRSPGGVSSRGRTMTARRVAVSLLAVIALLPGLARPELWLSDRESEVYYRWVMAAGEKPSRTRS